MDDGYDIIVNNLCKAFRMVAERIPFTQLHRIKDYFESKNSHGGKSYLGKSFEEIKDFLEKNPASLKWSTEFGDSLLHLSIHHMQSFSLIDYLLDKGVDKNATTTNGRTPLHVAVLYGRDKEIELLTSHGANIEAADSKGYTPLHLAAEANLYDEVKTLIRLGANIRAIDKNGEMPLDIAKKHELTETVLALEEVERDLTKREEAIKEKDHAVKREKTVAVFKNGLSADIPL